MSNLSYLDARKIAYEKELVNNNNIVYILTLNKKISLFERTLQC